MRRNQTRRIMTALTILIGSTFLFGCGKSEENQPAIGNTVGSLAPGGPIQPGTGQCMPIAYMSSMGGSGSGIPFTATGIPVVNNTVTAGNIPNVGAFGTIATGYNNMYGAGYPGGNQYGYPGGSQYGYPGGSQYGYPGGYAVQVQDTDGAYGTLQMSVIQGPTITATGTLNLNSLVINEIYYKAAAAGLASNTGQTYGTPYGSGYGGAYPYGQIPILPTGYPTSGVCISSIAIKADKLLNYSELINVDVYVYLNNSARALNVSTGQLF